ncbi:uncharacterized protein LOC127246818 isoform X3 [Andrographis paniculata]|uniref:uncharacterized protein LOC127246818 isoform X3 n=1 Tax=Andrographis paniculata TaxID=175694 RepID=UPI0021E870A7|nr:uncharacterized protein LOC127246818 isoform X3 [Andrographis paniculata]
MAHMVRPLIQWPWRRCVRTSTTAISHLPMLGSASTSAVTIIRFCGLFSIYDREVHFRSRGLKSRDVAAPFDVEESEDESSDSSGAKKSRNERKREARRAVRWASLEQEVYDALMLVKRLGRDVREGKRRQYNYIGRLLREVEPELMDSLIQATKDGDQNPFKKFASEEALSDDGEEEGEEEVSDEHEEEDPLSVAVAIRWYDGLIAKNTTITNEIYSLQDVDFDRQELRQLVRKVHASLEAEASLEDHGKPITAAVKARRSLMQFLQHVAKQLPDECAINRFHYE